jgi:hypothetical protein
MVPLPKPDAFVVATTFKLQFICGPAYIIGELLVEFIAFPAKPEFIEFDASVVWVQVGLPSIQTAEAKQPGSALRLFGGLFQIRLPAQENPEGLTG